MALTLVNLSGFQRGVASNEAGININRFSIEISPEINDWLPGKDGQARGKAVGDPMGKLTLEGEIFDVSVGIMAASFIAAFAPVNTTAFFGRSAGGFYLDRGTVTQDRSGWRDANAELESRFGVA